MRINKQRAVKNRAAPFNLMGDKAFLSLWFVAYLRGVMVTAIKLSVVGAGHARDEESKTQALQPKYRGHGSLLRWYCGSGVW